MTETHFIRDSLGATRILHRLQDMGISVTLDDFGTPQPVRTTGTVNGRALYVGGYAGAALGYRSFFVGPELTLTYLFGAADVDALGGRDNVSVSSLVVYPSFAVMGEL